MEIAISEYELKILDVHIGCVYTALKPFGIIANIKANKLNKGRFRYVF